MRANYKTVFQVDDKKLLNLNIIRKRDVLDLWLQIRDDIPLRIWIGLVSVWEERGKRLKKVRKPVWFFLDGENICYSYLPFSGEICLIGFYHRQYPPIWWIYNNAYYCGEIDGDRTYVSLLAVGNIMMTF